MLSDVCGRGAMGREQQREKERENTNGWADSQLSKSFPRRCVVIRRGVRSIDIWGWIRITESLVTAPGGNWTSNGFWGGRTRSGCEITDWLTDCESSQFSSDCGMELSLEFLYSPFTMIWLFLLVFQNYSLFGMNDLKNVQFAWICIVGGLISVDREFIRETIYSDYSK